MRILPLGFTAVALLLAGCGEEEPLPPPGAHGQALVHLWSKDGGPPLAVETEHIEQARPGDFEQLHLKPVRIRIEGPEGVFYVHAERGIFSKAAADSLVLEPVQAGGRIHLSGFWRVDGEPFFGVAARAVFRQEARLLAMQQRVELVQRGRLDVFLERPRPPGAGEWPQDWTVIPPMVFWNREQRFTLGPNPRIRASTPALVAALAVMPRPMTLPAPERGLRSSSNLP